MLPLAVANAWRGRGLADILACRTASPFLCLLPHSALRNPVILRRLLGCSLTWFLYDICFFGNAIFAPVVIDGIFGGSGSLRECESCQGQSQGQGSRGYDSG